MTMIRKIEKVINRFSLNGINIYDVVPIDSNRHMARKDQYMPCTDYLLRARSARCF
jgi:hypothetical protein